MNFWVILLFCFSLFTFICLWIQTLNLWVFEFLSFCISEFLSFWVILLLSFIFIDLHSSLNPNIEPYGYHRFSFIFLSQSALNFGFYSVYGSFSMKQFHSHLKIPNPIIWQLFLLMVMTDTKQQTFCRCIYVPLLCNWHIIIIIG